MVLMRNSWLLLGWHNQGLANRSYDLGSFMRVLLYLAQENYITLRIVPSEFTVLRICFNI